MRRGSSSRTPVSIGFSPVTLADADQHERSAHATWVFPTPVPVPTSTTRSAPRRGSPADRITLQAAQGSDGAVHFVVSQIGANRDSEP